MQLFFFSKSHLLSHLCPITNFNRNSVFNSSISFYCCFSLSCSNSVRFAHKLSSSSPLHEEIKISKEPKPEQTDTDESILVARRPVMDLTVQEESIRSRAESQRTEEEDDMNSSYSSKIDEKMSEIAKKLPIFQPENVKTAPPVDRPLLINLELALYRAKEHTRKFEFDKAEELLLKV
jgi:hypothetical protein